MRSSFEVSDAKARRELGHTLRPFEETVRDTVRWYLAHQLKKIVNAAPIQLKLAQL